MAQRTRVALEGAFWFAAFAAFWLLPRQQALLNEVVILALFALSLDFIVGFAGIVSLGHAAFFGTGAYAAGLFALHVSPNPLPGLVFAGSCAAALGFAASFLILRGSDLTRLMVTLGLALLLAEIANSAAFVTGGADGLQGIVMGPLPFHVDFDLGGHVAYGYGLCVLFLAFLVCRPLLQSPFGLSLRAIRDNRLRAGSLGVPINRRLVTIYTLAACYAGLAGGLLAQTTQFVSLDVLDFQRSSDVLLVLILGGPGTLYGALVGSLVYKLVQSWLSDITPQYWQFWLGALLVAFVLTGREPMSTRVMRFARGCLR